MTSPQDLDTRVRQHHDEIIAIYELLEKTDEKVDKIAEVQQEHGSRLAEMQHTLELHDTKLSIQSDTLRNMRHSMKRLEGNQRKVNERLDGHGERLDSQGEKLDSHSDKLDEILGLLRQGR